jgi:hypothetical protein
MTKLTDTRRTLQEKKTALEHTQQTQINTLLDNLGSSEQDEAFEWSLAQLDQIVKTSWLGKSEIVTLTVYVKRAPRKDLNPFVLYENIERMKADHGINKLSPPPTSPPIQIFELKKSRYKKATRKKANRKSNRSYDSYQTSSGPSSSDSESFKSAS